MKYVDWLTTQTLSRHIFTFWREGTYGAHCTRCGWKVEAVGMDAWVIQQAVDHKCPRMRAVR